jgi:hypothetical protein
VANKSKEQHMLDGTEPLDWKGNSDRSLQLLNTMAYIHSRALTRLGYGKDRKWDKNKEALKEIVNQVNQEAPRLVRELGWRFGEGTAAFEEYTLFIFNKQTDPKLASYQGQPGLKYRVRGQLLLNQRGFRF